MVYVWFNEAYIDITSPNYNGAEWHLVMFMFKAAALQDLTN